MILMDISKLTSLKIEMEKVSVKMKDILRERYPFMEVTAAEAAEDDEIEVGFQYAGDRERELVYKINPQANSIEELTVPETLELVEWLEKHAWILEGENE